MDDLMKRTDYFDGEFLQTEDFKEEQEYHIDRRRRHARSRRTPGVVEGLEVRGKIGSRTVEVQPGAVKDTSGRGIVLMRAATVRLPDGPRKAEIWLVYSGKPKEKRADRATKEAFGRTKKTLSFLFRRLDEPPEPEPPNGVRLAYLTLVNGGLAKNPRDARTRG